MLKELQRITNSIKLTVFFFYKNLTRFLTYFLGHDLINMTSNCNTRWLFCSPQRVFANYDATQREQHGVCRSHATAMRALPVRYGARSAETRWRRITPRILLGARSPCAILRAKLWAPGPSGGGNERRTNTRYYVGHVYAERGEQDGGSADARESHGYGGSVQETALHCSPALTGPSLISSLG